jgi:hypothetical protein
MQKQPILFDAANLSAFGTLEIGSLTPVLQGDFVYGLNSQVWNTPVVSGSGATIDSSSSRLRIQSGNASTGYAYVTSKKIIRYRAGQGTVARFTPVFSPGVANNIQLLGVGALSNNIPYDGYYFGYNGTSFGIAYYNTGNVTWIPPSLWNGDNVGGSSSSSFSWDPTKGTPVMIKYPFLGYGDTSFFAQIPQSGQWTLLHTIRYANTSVNTELSNPSLQFIGFNQNINSSTNQTMYVGSIGMFISGERNFISNPHWGIDNSKAAITTETSLLNIKNCTTYNGMHNRGMIRINSISFASNNNSISTLLFKLNSTLTGGPGFTPINGSTADNGTTITNGNSIASYDTSIATISGGSYIFNLSIGQTSNANVDLTSLEILLAPGDILTVSAKSTASATLGTSINWSEDI